MRFNQLKKKPNAIIRKKLYKKGKCWVVASSLAFASGLMFLGASGMSVNADAVSDSVTQGQTVSDANVVTTSSKIAEPSASASDVTNEVKSGNSNSGDNTDPKVVEPEKVQPQTTSEDTGTSSEPSNDESTTSGPQQDGNESNSTGDSAAKETPETQDITDVNYDPQNNEYTDTSHWTQSGSKYTIADNLIPDKIKQEGIVQRGMDGTSPYFITNSKNLYFLNGTLDANFTRQMIQGGIDAYDPNATYPDSTKADGDFMRNNVLNIDTSLAKKVYLPENSQDLFSQLGNQEGFGKPEYAPTFDFSGIDTTEVKNMAGMFSNSNFKTLDLRPFDTLNVTDMHFMFANTNFSQLDLSSFNTSKVTDMSNMFSGVNSYNIGTEAPSLDLSSFDTSNVKNMSNMFKNSVFSSLNLKSFDTSKVIDMSNMFDTTTVPSLDLSSFNTSKVGTMNNMFANFDTIKNMVLNDYLYSPADLNVSSFKGDGLSASDAIDSMFMDARLKDINMPYFKVSSDTVTSGSEVFNDIAADSVSIPNFDGSKIQNWSQFFSGADINKLDISTWNISNNDSSMFDDSHIKQITLGPANKFTANTYLPTSDETTEKDKWISISPNGVVDSPENAKTFYASPSEGTRGMSNYDDLGGVSVLSFVPDVDITDKVNLNVPTTVDGKADEDVTYPDLYGRVGVPIILDVPEKEGYQADKKTITAIVNADKTITTDDVINYTKIPIGGTGGTSQNIFISDRPQVATTPQRISIYPDQGNVTLYKQEGQKFVPITNRELAASSDWYYDKVAHVGSENSDMKYYRVSTNEWVRANQAYLYQPNKVIIRTKAGAPKQLIHAEGTLATSRMISPNTDWYSDLIGDLGEGQYYRVATNEFVNKADVTVIKNA